MRTPKQKFERRKLQAMMSINRKIIALLNCTLEDLNEFGNWNSEDFKYNNSYVAADKAKKWHKLAGELDKRRRLQRRYLKQFTADAPASLWNGVMTVEVSK